MKFSPVIGMAVAAHMSLTIATGNACAQGILDATFAQKEGQTQEISTSQLRRILADGSATVIDTRTRAEFDAGYIPGARVLDAEADDQIAAVERLSNGNKAAALVLYCNGPYCQASRRLGEKLSVAGFTNVRRYQLGIPIWRALGGPTAIGLGGFKRIFNVDRSAVYLDARASGEFSRGSLPGAHSVPVEDVISGKLKKIPLPEDDFNRRIVLFGNDSAEARKLADVLRTRPWHNVAYFDGSFEALAATLKSQ